VVVTANGSAWLSCRVESFVTVDDDPLKAVRESVGPTFEGKEIDDLREDARTAIAGEARREAGRKSEA